jgi:uncharacterized protein (DUF433 family)
MTVVSDQQTEIVRTERGLTISGTRITLYDVMDYLKAQYPPKFIQDSFNLTDEQISTVLSYIDLHATEVEAEYQEVLQISKEIQQYWEKRNQEHFARIATVEPRPGYEAVRSKLAERRSQRQSSQV